MPATVAPATARPGDLIALVCLDTYAGTYALAPEPVADTAPADVIPARVARVIIDRDGSTLLEIDWMRDETAGRIGRTSRTFRVPAAPARTTRTAVGTVRDVLAAAGVTVGRLAVRPSSTAPGAVALSLPYDLGAQVDALDALAAAGWDAAPVSGTLYRVTRAPEPDTCEHDIPMTDPCGPCAVAGHEPVDVDEPESRTDNQRHLADCRGCALLQPDGHAYASLIDQKLTAAELAALAAHPDADDAVRLAAAAAVAELTADADLAGVAAYDAAMAAGLGRHVAREHAAVTACQHEGVDWNDAAPEVRIAYRTRFSSRPAYAADGPAPVLGGRIHVEHGA